MIYFYQAALRFKTLTNWEPCIVTNTQNLCILILLTYTFQRQHLLSLLSSSEMHCLAVGTRYTLQILLLTTHFLCTTFPRDYADHKNKYNIHTHTNTIKQFMLFTYLVSLETEARSHVIKLKLHNITIFPGRNDTIRLHWQLKANEKRTGRSKGHS